VCNCHRMEIEINSFGECVRCTCSGRQWQQVRKKGYRLQTRKKAGRPQLAPDLIFHNFSRLPRLRLPSSPPLHSLSINFEIREPVEIIHDVPHSSSPVHPGYFGVCASHGTSSRKNDSMSSKACKIASKCAQKRQWKTRSESSCSCVF